MLRGAIGWVSRDGVPRPAHFDFCFPRFAAMGAAVFSPVASTGNRPAAQAFFSISKSVFVWAA